MLLLLLQSCIKRFPNLRIKLWFGQRLGSWFVIRIIYLIFKHLWWMQLFQRWWWFVCLSIPMLNVHYVLLSRQYFKKQQNTRYQIPEKIENRWNLLFKNKKLKKLKNQKPGKMYFQFSRQTKPTNQATYSYSLI